MRNPRELRNREMPGLQLGAPGKPAGSGSNLAFLTNRCYGCCVADIKKHCLVRPRRTSVYFWRQIPLFVQNFRALRLFVHVEVTKRAAGHEQGPPRQTAMNFGQSVRAMRQTAPADGLRSTPRAKRKRRGRPRIRTARYWREYYARKQREWRAAHPDWRQRRKEGKVKRRKKPGSDS